MALWKSIAIGLAVILVLSYAGFAFVYSQGGGIMIAGMVTGGMQPKVITLLTDQNVTSSWNASVNVLGYKTGFLYVNVSALGNLIDGVNRPFMLDWCFEADGIKGSPPRFLLGTGELDSQDVYVEPIDMAGSQLWLFLRPSSDPSTLPVVWTVISMSLYLRD